MNPKAIKALQHKLADAYKLIFLSQQILLAHQVEPRDIHYISKNLRDALNIINEVEKQLDDLRRAEEEKVKVIDIGPEDLV